MDEIKVVPYIPDEDYDNPAMVVDFYEFTMANCLFLHGFKTVSYTHLDVYKRQGEDYGFAEPALTIEVTAAGETDTYTFGASNAMTGDLYVRKNNSDVIYTVSGLSLIHISQSMPSSQLISHPMSASCALR